MLMRSTRPEDLEMPLSGFSDYVTYREENKWGSAWSPSGRGVEGVASRAAKQPDCGAVDDESLLYVGDLLRSPGSFVSTIDGEIDSAAWKTLPSWAVVGTEDKVIPPDTQRSMYERAGAKITEVAASHVSMVSHPQVAIDTILAAAAHVGD